MLGVCALTVRGRANKDSKDWLDVEDASGLMRVKERHDERASGKVVFGDSTVLQLERCRSMHRSVCRHTNAPTWPGVGMH